MRRDTSPFLALPLCALLIACADPTAPASPEVAAAPAAEAAAPDFPGARPGDAPVPADELDSLLRGNLVTYDEGGASEYRADGSYVFLLPDGTVGRRGEYRLSDGRSCLYWPGGSSRCDRIVRTEDGLVLVNAQGGRFAIVDVAPL